MFFPPSAGEAAMGGSSFKRILFWKKKKTSPLEKAWKQMRRALPNKKQKKKRILSLDKLRRKKKHSQKNVSQTIDQKEPGLLTRLSLGSIKKESTETAPPTKKDVGALEKIREHIKGKTSQDSTKGVSAKREDDSVNQEETKGENGAKNKEKVPKKTLKGLMKSIRPTGPKAHGEAEETEQ